jgi:hypothetical protein
VTLDRTLDRLPEPIPLVGQKHVFVDGRMVNIEAAEAPAGRGGRGRGGD